MPVTADKQFTNGTVHYEQDGSHIRLTFTPNAVGKLLRPLQRKPLVLEVAAADSRSIAAFEIVSEQAVFDPWLLREGGWTGVRAGGKRG
jgi:hypothetical protein